jgi:Ca2+-binding EF-hand superfamily protein
MNEFALSEYVERLESTFLNSIHSKPEDRLTMLNSSCLTDIRDILNKMFPENECLDTIFTLNTDKQFFGIYVSPVITPNDALAIIATDDKIKLNKYKVEFDSKIFNLGLDAVDITAYLIFEVSSVMDSYEAVDKVRDLVNLYISSMDSTFRIRDSVNYSQILICALKDTLYKVTSLLFKEDQADILANPMVQAADIAETTISTREKIINSISCMEDGVRSPKTIILQWMFMVYRDIQHNQDIIRSNMEDSITFTGSKLQKEEFEKVINAVTRIGAEVVYESSLPKQLERNGFYSKILEGSFFKSLKKNGLRSIEDAYYEFALRMKNCETEEDAMYIIHGINTRLNVLEDYIVNTPELSDAERRRWEGLATKYRTLREELIKKNITNKKQYGLFFDYDQLDRMDD